MKLLTVVIVSYLVGALPIGYLAARKKGIDIRKRGSGNIGATNVWRNLGPALGLAVFAGDVLKGVVAVLLGRYLAGGSAAPLVTALAALVGHSWSVFLGFQGGKIIATAFGVFLLLDLPAAAVGMAVWLVVTGVSGYVSLGSVVAIISVPVFMLFSGRPLTYVLFALTAGGIAVFKHRSNIQRLLAGTEKRIGRL